MTGSGNRQEGRSPRTLRRFLATASIAAALALAAQTAAYADGYSQHGGYGHTELQCSSQTHHVTVWVTLWKDSIVGPQSVSRQFYLWNDVTGRWDLIRDWSTYTIGWLDAVYTYPGDGITFSNSARTRYFYVNYDWFYKGAWQPVVPDHLLSCYA